MGRLVEDSAGWTDALETSGRVAALAVAADVGVFAFVDVKAFAAASVRRVAVVADASKYVIHQSLIIPLSFLANKYL